MLGEQAALGEDRQPRGSRDGRIAGVGAVVTQQRFECVSALVRTDSDVGAFRHGSGAPIWAQAPQAIAVAGRRLARRQWVKASSQLLAAA